ncbi:hypothetical protein BU25DRAFT_345820 [Macroventuria anomochaeta]|uniref:Uncharacterized protein n=1 Tax=Macroventuria anomochaeta TaxID=301207 RepID=A0ACB6RV87_9PLEO|nr:uncharacterized protein BU25DRAFT_345820 [Macroventuria anomochaeta]KAF2625622.1 hypothetical protein BU25DRAFT_345820 [Macroventuria anomochaeta]
MPLLRRRIRCHFCNQQSRHTVSHVPSTYLCPQCDAVNHFDERGTITDPPTEEIATAASPSCHYANALPRSSSPIVPPEPPSLFCNSCQRNQLLLNKTLAEYLPDEDDPEYDKYASSLDAYRNELEHRYPQVCQDCLPRVQDQIRAAGYAAKADNLRRIIDRSREHSRTVQTSRQTWTLRLIALAKWVYLSSVVVGLLWHAMGLTIAPAHSTDAGEQARWSTCLAQAFAARRAHQSCVVSPLARKLLQGSLVADLLTTWWNPKLASKTNSITGRMRGLKSLWSIRVIVLMLRTASFVYWNAAPLYSSNLTLFHNTNIVLLIAISLSFALTWRTVRIVYTPVALPEETYLPSAPNSPQRPQSSYKPAHPQTSTFDTMAQGFTSSFQVDSTSALPPSPTLTEASTTSHYTEFTTPARKSVYQDDSMDWTPTTRRFAPSAPEILPPQFGTRSPVQPQAASPSLPRRQEPVSLFAKPDPNPFRHKVPAAPKAPAQATLDPWKRGAWVPPLKETTPNFFKTERQTRRGRGAGKGLEGFGVPKNVQRDAELFASPKFKYDYYGTMKDTGLEETFNGLFSK